MKFPYPGAKILAGFQVLEPARVQLAFASAVRHLVSPPVELHIRPLNSPEYYQAGNGDSRRERGREQEVELGPHSQPPLANEQPAEPRNGHCGDDVAHVVRRPVGGTRQHDDGMYLSQPRLLGEPALDSPEGDGYSGTEREA